MRGMKGLIYAAAIAAMIGCLSGCSFGWKTNYVYPNGEKYTAGDREITEKIETINLNYLSGGVKLVTADTDALTIRETSERKLDDDRKVHTWVDGTTLYIRYCASAKGLDLNLLEKNLEILIPEGTVLDIVKMNVSSGNITLNCDTKTADLSASSGSITMKLTGDSEDIKLSTSSGIINVDIKDADKVKLHSSSGKVQVLAGQIREFRSDVSSGSGEYRFTKAPEKSEIAHSSGAVTVYLPKDTDLTGDFSTSSGKVFYELAFSRKGDDYVCGNGTNQMKIHVSSGNIDIKAE